MEVKGREGKRCGSMGGGLLGSKKGSDEGVPKGETLVSRILKFEYFSDRSFFFGEVSCESFRVFIWGFDITL